MSLDLFRLGGKTALVTGASRGLGAGMAIALAAAGAEVALHASAQPAADTANEIHGATGRPTHLLTGDLSDPTTPHRLIDEAISKMGRIDILVNNAGIIRRQPAAEHSDELWDSVIEVNLSSVFRLCRSAGAHMIERREGGKIINVASLLSFQGGITVPGYAAAKGGVMQLTKALANEWAPYGDHGQRDCPRLHGDRQHRRPFARTPVARAVKSTSAFPPGVGELRRIWRAP